MEITIVLDDGSRHKATLPYDGCDHCTCDIACPHGCKRVVVLGIPLRLKISGTGIKHQDHDTMYADAIALCCKRKVGTIETRLNTLFGLDEDQRVLGGPWKVF